MSRTVGDVVLEIYRRQIRVLYMQFQMIACWRQIAQYESWKRILQAEIEALNKLEVDGWKNGKAVFDS